MTILCEMPSQGNTHKMLHDCSVCNDIIPLTGDFCTIIDTYINISLPIPLKIQAEYKVLVNNQGGKSLKINSILSLMQ